MKCVKCGVEYSNRHEAAHCRDVVTRREELEAITKMLGEEIRAEMNDANTGKPIGFILMLYDFGPGGFLAYTGNGNREDSIRLLREHLRMLETQTQ